MLTYYRFFHPSGPITLFGPPNVPPHTLTQPNNDVERSNTERIATSQENVPTDRSSMSQSQTGPSQMPTDVEKTNSLRSLKHLWSVDRDGSLSR